MWNLDYILISAPDWRWNKTIESILQAKLRGVCNNTKIITLDSGMFQHKTTNWLLGEVLSILVGKWVNYLVKEEIYKDEFRSALLP